MYKHFDQIIRPLEIYHTNIVSQTKYVYTRMFIAASLEKKLNIKQFLPPSFSITD